MLPANLQRLNSNTNTPACPALGLPPAGQSKCPVLCGKTGQLKCGTPVLCGAKGQPVCVNPTVCGVKGQPKCRKPTKPTKMCICNKEYAPVCTQKGE